jgi:hypothetical protein
VDCPEFGRSEQAAALENSVMVRWMAMFERYTETARRVIFFARYEASQVGGTTIDTEHLLLGLLREDRDLARRFLGPDAVENTRREIMESITVREKVSVSIDLPLTGEGKRILAYAAEEAEKLASTNIGTEHILLGILREESGLAAQILLKHGLTANGVREELARSPRPPKVVPVAPAPSHSPSSMFAALRNPVLPHQGVVAHADTARRIAEAVWLPLFGAEAVESQRPIKAELRFNVWIVTGSATEKVLFAFILQTDGRVFSVGPEL